MNWQSVEVCFPLEEDGGIRWWEEYEVLRRKVELVNVVESLSRLKNKIKARNEKDWEEEVYMKSTLKWWKLT